MGCGDEVDSGRSEVSGRAGLPGVLSVTRAKHRVLSPQISWITSLKGICTGGDQTPKGGLPPLGSKIQDFGSLPEQDLSDADTVTLPQRCNQFAQATQCSLALPDPLFMLIS